MQEQAITRTINYSEEITPDQRRDEIAKKSSEALLGEKRSRDNGSPTAHLHPEEAKVLKTEDSQRSPS